MDSDATYSRTNYTIFFTPLFNDYETTGNIIIQFHNNDYSLFGSVSVLINSQLKTIVVNATNGTI